MSDASTTSPAGSELPAAPCCGCQGEATHPRPRPQLGDRELDALLSWLRHDSKRAAAAEIYVSESTVSTHIERIRRKYAALGRPANTKAALLARAIQDGLLDLDEL